MAGGFDISRAPRDEMAAAALVLALAGIGGLRDRHYLELEGPRSLASKADQQKVAKFILGAANRLTDKAHEAFEGYGAMIIGITSGGRGVTNPPSAVRSEWPTR